MSSATIGGLFICALSLYLLNDAFRSVRKLEKAQAWPKTNGKMLTGEVFRPQSTRPRHDFHARYEYAVDGQSYTCDRVAFYTITSKEQAEALAQSHSPGAMVDVYYDPDNPADGTLINKPNPDGKKYGEAGVGLIALVVGAAVFVFSLI